MNRGAIRAVLSFVVGSALLAGCGEAGQSTEGVSGWTLLPESPLSPRFGARAFWVGDQIVVMGGSADRPCPPNADCVPSTPMSDGASFNPVTGTWREIADAPVRLGGASAAVLGETVYLLMRESVLEPGVPPPVFLAYDTQRDVWHELPLPPNEAEIGFTLAVAGERLIVYQGSQENGVEQDLMFEPVDQTWTELPPDPLIPSFDRTMVWTDAGLVMTGIEDVPQPGSTGPALYRAAVLDLESLQWKRFPDSEVVGYEPAWFWSDGQVVNPTLGSSDGGEVGSWGRSYPHGGILDPETGTWSHLPPAPKPSGYPGVSLGGGDYAVSLMGAVLHVPSGRWFELPPPPGAGTDEAVTWADDGLFVWGGVRWDGYESFSLVSDGWFWRPPKALTRLSRCGPNGVGAANIRSPGDSAMT